VDKDLPWHSTSSRTRQLYPATIFKQLFEHVFARCVAAGLVSGYTQALAFVKVNASLESSCEKQPADAPTPVLHVAHWPAQEALDAPAFRAKPGAPLRRVAAAHTRYVRHDSGPLGRDRPHTRLLNNKTHYSPADPDARILVKPSKARAINCL